MATSATQRSSHNTETEYNLPNDTVEHTRLEEQAAGLAELMHNRVIHAPLYKPERILDIGCGTGAVTHHLGLIYPTASSVYGIDISPVPFVRRFETSPSNISYIQGDVKKLLRTDARLASESFDYVFSRLLVCGMTDWAGYMRDTVMPLLKPGGWAEVQDLDEIWYKHGRVCSSEWKWLQTIDEGAKGKDLDLRCGSNAAKYMREAGLVDINVSRYAIPSGTWAADERPQSRRIGTLQAKELAPLYDSIVPRMVEGLGLSDAEVRGLVEESRRCLQADEGKERFIYVTVGRRPSA